MIGYIIFAIALVGTIYASYTDIKIREVSNWLSFGMIFLFLLVRVFQGLVYKEFNAMWMSLLAGGIFFAIGIAFFYAQQWGGADMKLLAAFGLGFGSLWPEFSPYFMGLWPFFLTLLVDFFVIAAIYSLILSFVLAFTNTDTIRSFRESITKEELLIGGIMIIAGFVLSLYSVFALIVFAAPLLWFLSKFLRRVENICMKKCISVNQLVEFDVPAKDLVVDEKVVASSKDPDGLSLEKIDEIRELAKEKKVPHYIEVKWGIPLVPVFPITLVVALFFGDLMMWFLTTQLI